MSSQTLAGLRRMTEHLSDALRAGGVLTDTERLYLCEGSQTYGRGYRLVTLRDGDSAHYSAPVDFLGWNKREAYQTLAAMSATLYAVRRAQAVNA